MTGTRSAGNQLFTDRLNNARGTAESFDLVIVDIFLQGTNGSDLITTLRGRVPGLPVIAISGMTALDFLPEMPELSDVVCLQKPFRPPDLTRAVEAAQGSLQPSAAAVAAAAG